MQDPDQLIMDDLDDLLARRDRFRDGLTGCLGLNRFDEIAGNGQADIGFQQRDTHLAQGGFDVILGQGALLGQPVEDAPQAF